MEDEKKYTSDTEHSLPDFMMFDETEPEVTESRATSPAGNDVSSPIAPEPGGKPKKRRMTRQQLWWRHSVRQAIVFFLLGIILSAMLIVLCYVITLPFRPANAETAPSLSETELEESAEPGSDFDAASVETPEPEIHSVSLLAVGDNLIHNTVYEFAQQADGSYDFSEIYSYLKDEIAAADIACIQQETILVKDKSLYSNYPAFGTPAEMADSLAAVGFDVICHASNHTYDKWDIGIQDTLDAWSQYPDITVLGIHDSQEDADEITIVEKNGIKIAMLDYAYGVNYTVPVDDYLIDFMDDNHRDRIGSMVEQAKNMSDIVVVFMHRGTEDSLVPDSGQLEWAQFFADHGAGLIIGTHPHAVEPVDVITGTDGNATVVFYSLGNFISSQNDTCNLTGGMANVTITKDVSGTYVSDYSLSPVVTLIERGGIYGSGYQFHVMHLEDYTDEMAMRHIRENCTPADFHAVWDDMYAQWAEMKQTTSDTLPQ